MDSGRLRRPEIPAREAVVQELQLGLSWVEDDLREIARRSTQRGRLLRALLSCPDGISGAQLELAAGRRFSARVHELNTEPRPRGLVGTGCRIVCTEQRAGFSSYQLLRDQEEVATCASR